MVRSFALALATMSLDILTRLMLVEMLRSERGNGLEMR